MTFHVTRRVLSTQARCLPWKPRRMTDCRGLIVGASRSCKSPACAFRAELGGGRLGVVEEEGVSHRCRPSGSRVDSGTRVTNEQGRDRHPPLVEPERTTGGMPDELPSGILSCRPTCEVPSGLLLAITVVEAQDGICADKTDRSAINNGRDPALRSGRGVRIMTPQDHKVSLHAHSSRRGCLGLPDERDRMSAQPLARRSRSQCRRARSASQRQMMTADQPDDAAVPPWRREGSLPDARCA